MERFYLYAVAIIRIYLRQSAVTNYIKMWELSYFSHCLLIADDATVVTQHICFLIYQTIVLKTAEQLISKVRSKLIPPIYREIFLKLHLQEIQWVKTLSLRITINSVWHFDQSTVVWNKYILINNKNYLLKLKSNHILKEIPLNSYLKE